MRHSWQELEDGTARCRLAQREFARHVEYQTFNDAPYVGSAYDYEVPIVVKTMAAVLVVEGAHPTKCGRPAK